MFEWLYDLFLFLSDYNSEMGVDEGVYIVTGYVEIQAGICSSVSHGPAWPPTTMVLLKLLMAMVSQVRFGRIILSNTERGKRSLNIVNYRDVIA